jgi:HD-GYP domain-containing protein (c-di-GMP phosphodiesterase class II)
VALLAITTSVTVLRVWPSQGIEPLGTLILLALVAGTAERLRVARASGGYASFAGWPLLVAVFIAPSWEAVATAFVASVIMQLLARRMLLKSVFNVAQTVLTIGVAVVIFRSLGGKPFPLLDTPGWFESATNTSKIDGIPAVIGILGSYVCQSFAVSAVLSLAERKPISVVLKSDYERSLLIALLSAPIIPWFAWQTTHAGILIALLPATVLSVIWILFIKQTELDRTHQDLLTLMVSSIESRDPYTSGHSQRVQKYSTIIGRALGLSSDELERLGMAALLHDVGKAHPKHATWLKKPGALTRDEMLVMQEHPQDGAFLVGAAKTLRDIADPILHHHENWDGSGFPKLLSGTDIPMFSRIIRVADAIDAMTTTRPYKAKKNPDQVSVELVEFQGTWFDPHIISTLLDSPQWTTLRREIDRNEISGPRNFGLTPRPYGRRVPAASAN